MASPSLAVTPSTLVAQAVPFGGCPTVSPFNVPFNLIVTTGGGVVTVTDITVRFTDTRGMAAPQVTLPAPVPTIPFGSALTQARQDFPLRLSIGCGTGHTGTIVVIVGTRDRFGRFMSTQVSAPVR
jgi:hypothetical protein